MIEEDKFQHILRILNTNVDGRLIVPFALCKIKGIGPRFATLLCRKAEIDVRMRYCFVFSWIIYAKNRVFDSNQSANK